MACASTCTDRVQFIVKTQLLFFINNETKTRLRRYLFDLVISSIKSQGSFSAPHINEAHLRERCYHKLIASWHCKRNQTNWQSVITAKILFQILLCRTCVVYKFFAEKTRTEIEQTE